MLASLIDVVQHWSWMQIGSKKIPRPEPFPRPSDGPARTELSPKEIGARLRALEQRRR